MTTNFDKEMYTHCHLLLMSIVAMKVFTFWPNIQSPVILPCLVTWLEIVSQNLSVMTSYCLEYTFK